MKKQLIAAAVAATMTSVAMADISITGAAKINYTNVDYDSASVNDSDTFKHEMDLKVKGQNGDTTVVINFGDIDSSGTTADAGMNIEDAYVSTKVGDVSIQAGQWDNGNNALRDSERTAGKFSASTTISGVTVTYEAANAADDTVKVAGSIGPVALSYKDVKIGEDITVATSVGGVNVSYLALQRDTANTDRSVIEVSGSVGGVEITAAKAEAESDTSIGGDTWMGDFEVADSDTGAYQLSNDQDVTSIRLKTAVAGNTVQFINTNVDGVSGQDTSFNKFIVTRPLANGTTFEATYTDLDDDGSTTTDSTSLDLELAVKF